MQLKKKNVEQWGVEKAKGLFPLAFMSLLALNADVLGRPP